MARQILGGVGAIIGGVYGGAAGAQWGWAIGSMIGGAIDPQIIKGPSIGDVAQQTSQEGGPIPIVFGMSSPIAGNIIATSDPRIVKTRQSQGKGGPKVETESVYRTYALGVCEGPTTGFRRVWRNGTLVYDASEGSTLDNAAFLEKARFFLGDYEQDPSPDLEAIYGVGTTPAHRGLVYMVMADDDLTDLRGAIPQYVFQVAGAITSVVIYDTPGIYTWTKPSGLSSAEVRMLGAGGGGAGGGAACGASNEFGSGGAGGGGGYSTDTYAAAILGATETVTVGAGGVGGAGALQSTSGEADGSSGVDGEATTFGTHLTAGGGQRGGFAGNADGGDGGSGVTETGGAGGEGDVCNAAGSQAATDGGSTTNAGPGGGGGGPLDAFDEAGPAGTGGSSFAAVGGAAGAGEVIASEYSDAIGTHGGSGGEGVAVSAIAGGGGGGGGCAGAQAMPGGANGGAATAGDGASGGVHGAGGGGGGGAQSDDDIQPGAGVTPAPAQGGAGGDGAGGLCVVESTFTDGIPLAVVIAAICDRAGMTQIDTSQIDGSVHGFVITNAYPAYSALAALSEIFLFDPSNYDGVLHFIPRGGGSVATITEQDMLDDEEDIEQQRRSDAISIPRVLNLNYFDVAGGLNTDKQTSERPGDRRSLGDTSLQTAVLLTADEAAQTVVKNHKILIEDQKGELRFSLPDSWLKLAAADPTIVQWQGRSERCRITQIDTHDGFQTYTLLRDRQSAYTSDVEGIPAAPQTAPPSSTVGPTLIEVLDLPLLRDADDAIGLGYYVAVSGMLAAWQGALVELSYDGGVNYTESSTTRIGAIMGETTSALADHPQEFPDQVHTVTVRIDTPDAELEETDLAGLLNQENYALIGDEIAQFATADQLSSGEWELGYFLRGRLRTEAQPHLTGERFILLDRAAMAFVPASMSDIGRTLTFRATSFGAATDSGTVTTLAFVGQSQIEFAPGYLTARIDGSDAIVAWQGAGRLGAGASVAHGARFAGYRVTFDDGTASIEVDTAAQELTQDVSTLSTPITVRVAQLNDLTGAGPFTEVTIG